MSGWEAWLGREERRTDRVDAEMARRWCATLNRALPDDGTVPQGLHWCLCLPDAPTERLGPDGHPLRDDSPDRFLPPIPLPRRMWAASTVEFRAPLRVGEAVERVSRIGAISEKAGKSGHLVFVEVTHETTGADGLSVLETQSIVYREAAGPDAPLSPSEPGSAAFDPRGWDRVHALVPDERLLFRYSALTFNSHRIHYDRPYAVDVERYRGLVVHGPLTATLLLDLARQHLGDNRLARFSFRGLTPGICGERLHLVLREHDGKHELGAFASDGRQVMSAEGKSACAQGVSVLRS